MSFLDRIDKSVASSLDPRYGKDERRDAVLLSDARVARCKLFYELDKAGFRIVPAELGRPYILDENGEPIHELRGAVDDVYRVLIADAPKLEDVL